MKVIDPNDSTHIIKVILRDALSISADLFIYDESTRQEVSFALSKVDLDGITTITFVASNYSPIEFTEDSTYQIKIVSNTSEVMYRDKMIATSQIPQDYKLTTNEYI